MDGWKPFYRRPRNTASINIIIELLLACLHAKSCAFELFSTCLEIMRESMTTSNQYPLESLFISFPNLSYESMTADIHDVDRIMNVKIRLLRAGVPAMYSENCMATMYQYIAKRNSDKAVVYVLKDCDVAFFQFSIIRDLQQGQQNIDDCLQTTWILFELVNQLTGYRPDFADEVYHVLRDTDCVPTSNPYYPSVLAATFRMNTRNTTICVLLCCLKFSPPVQMSEFRSMLVEHWKCCSFAAPGSSKSARKISVFLQIAYKSLLSV